MIDLRQLQALSAVASEGSVARAAARLGWSQPTVDHHLRNLDGLVGAELTERTSRGSTLTSAGKLMLERGREILGLADRALTDVRDLAHQGRVRLRFGTFPTVAAYLLPGIVRRLAEIGIELDTTLEEVAPLVSGVNGRTLDACLVYTASGYPLPFRADVHTTGLFADPLLLAVPSDHPLASQQSIDLDALLSLADEDWVTGATDGDTVDQLLHEFFAEHGRSVNVGVRTDDYSVVLGLVAASIAFALVPALAATRPPEGVALKPIDDHRFTRDLVLAAPGTGSGPSTAVRQLAEAVRRASADGAH